MHRGDVLIPGDEKVSAGRHCEREEVVVVRISGQSRRIAGIVKRDSLDRKAVHICAHLLRGCVGAELRSKQHVLEFVQQPRRHDEIELAVTPRVDDPRRSARSAENG